MVRINLAAALLLVLVLSIPSGAQSIGHFADHGGVGVTPKQGTATFDPVSSEYRITGGGANIWAKTDAFHYVWKRLSGDITLTADVSFLGEGANAHRKAALMIRQSLDPGSAYADVTVHGDGLTALQYRSVAGEETKEIRSPLKAPTTLRITRHGNQFTMTAGDSTSAPVTVILQDPVYVGLAVCSHDANVLETAVFSRVSVQSQILRSKVSIYDLAAKSVEVVYTANKNVEAPNWSPDGKYLLVNSGGDLWRVPLNGKLPAEPEKIQLSTDVNCNNDHGISPDGKTLIISGRTTTSSQIFTASIDGSNVRLMTPKAPSYYHGISPDGKWLAYTAQRDGDYDLHRVSIDGGEEQRLNRHAGLDDGPDYARDGKWIYFNSERTGNFDIWRIPADGASENDKKAEQVTSDEYEDWFPHPSPDGKWMVVLSYEKGTKGHPPNREVQLRLMPMPGRKLKTPRIESIVKLFGGQGTINVNSWSPDSKKFAFVTYELVTPQEIKRPKITGLAHVALYAKDVQKSREFYKDWLGYAEPFDLKNPDGSLALTFIKINDRQYIELFPERESGSDRLNHISIETDNAEAMRAYLASRGIKVPDRVGKGRIGNSNFSIKDPDGHTVEIVQYEPTGWSLRDKGKFMGSERISARMAHAGILVGSLEPALKFYRDVLGFQEFWRGSSDGKTLSWVNMKVPDGEDYIEFMLYRDPPVPDRRGTQHHLCLFVPDIEKAAATLNARPYRKDYTRPLEIRTGINRKRQYNLFDPDGTRVELMEPVTVDGTPTPPSTAPPPR